MNTLPVPSRDPGLADDPASVPGAAPTDTPILPILRRRWRAVVGALLAALLVGAIYLQLAKPIYRSSGGVYINSVVEAGQAPVEHTVLTPAEAAGASQSITSAAVLQQAVDTRGLDDLAIFDDVPDVLAHLRQHLRVDADAPQGVVTITFEAARAEDAAAVVDAVLAAYLEHEGLLGQPRFGEPMDLGTTGGVSSEASEDASESDGADEAGAQRVAEMRLQQLMGAVTQAQVELAAAQQLDERAQRADLSQLVQMAEQLGVRTDRGLAELALHQAEVSRLQQLLAGLPEQYGPNHRQRQAYEQQIVQALQERADAEVTLENALRRALEQNLAGAQLQATELRAALEAQHRVVTPPVVPRVVLIDPAVVGPRPVRPSRARVLLAAVLGGLALGTGLALLREGRETAVENAPLPMAGELDVVAGRGVAGLPGRIDPQRLLQTADDAAPGQGDGVVLGTVPMLASGASLAGRGYEAAALAVHQVRAIVQVRAHQRGQRSFAFTSPGRGAGKTSVAVGVASSLATSGDRVLLVDADLSGRIQKGQTQQTGGYAADADGDREQPSVRLEQLAAEAGHLDDADARALARPTAALLGLPGLLDGRPLGECVISSSTPNLHLLPAVYAEPRHVGQLSDRTIAALLEASVEAFDIVIFDIGPVPGSVEGLLVCSQADGVVVVAAAGQPRGMLDKSLSYLKVVGASVAGTVLNRVGRDKADGSDTSAAPTGEAGPQRQWSPQDVSLEGSGILAAAVMAELDPQPETASPRAVPGQNDAAPAPAATTKPTPNKKKTRSKAKPTSQAGDAPKKKTAAKKSTPKKKSTRTKASPPATGPAAPARPKPDTADSVIAGLSLDDD